MILLVVIYAGKITGHRTKKTKRPSMVLFALGFCNSCRLAVGFRSLHMAQEHFEFYAIRSCGRRGRQAGPFCDRSLEASPTLRPATYDLCILVAETCITSVYTNWIVTLLQWSLSSCQRPASFMLTRYCSSDRPWWLAASSGQQTDDVTYVGFVCVFAGCQRAAPAAVLPGVLPVKRLWPASCSVELVFLFLSCVAALLRRSSFRACCQQRPAKA